MSGSSYQGALDSGGIITAALFALRAFSNNRKKLHVHLRMDNRTAVAYLLKIGGGGGHGLRC